MQETRTRRLALVDVRENLFVLGARHLGSLPGIFTKGVTDLLVILCYFYEALKEVFVDAFVDVDSGG